MLEDKLLIRKLRRGNKDALRVIYEKYRDDLLRLAAGLLKERSKAESRKAKGRAKIRGQGKASTKGIG